ncbi:MAG: S1 RNA-binding domain-containing protein, partial [Ruminococcus sp.]|nr:S1 RNA-binding domain-containing protein [Ruminococcus sp.]
MDYRPEGCLYRTAENQRYISTADGLREAMKRGIILEARAAVCNGAHDLIVELPCGEGIIPHDEGAVGVREGKTRDIAIISRVNKIVCFKVTDVTVGDDGHVCAFLSRAAAQEDYIRGCMSRLSAGDIIDAKVTHLEQFGCFVDIGCGVPSLIPIDSITVSRIAHPSDRVRAG